MKPVKIFAVLGALLALGCSSCAGAYKGGGAPMLGDAGESGSAANGGADDTRLPEKQMTAGVWSDADHYDFWKSLFTADQQTEGAFRCYADNDRGLNTAERIAVTVTDENGRPARGVKAALYEGDEIVFEAETDALGRAYLFGKGDSVVASLGRNSVERPAADGMTIEFGAGKVSESIDLMFVVDTTGSMGDEMGYLARELGGIVNRVAAANAGARLRVGLVFYRDEGDSYVTMPYRFADVGDPDALNTVVRVLSSQTAGGGGDYPEAVDRALSEAVDADWSGGTRLLFHVLDAPYHDDGQHPAAFAAAVKRAAAKGIRVIPVAASGLDRLGEYAMRSAALMTGGAYVFVTDDSGIGESHRLPTVGDYTVEFLSDLLVRLVIGYHTGVMPDPVPWRTLVNGQNASLG